MPRIAFVALALLVATSARAQYVPGPPPIYPPPVYQPAPYYPPPVYAPRPVYASPPVYYRGNPYARRAWVMRAVGIPLLSVGIPLIVAGGIVAIVGGACGSNGNCDPGVLNTGWWLLGTGGVLTVAGAIVLGIANYYRWMSYGGYFTRAHFDITPTQGGAIAGFSLRY